MPKKTTKTSKVVSKVKSAVVCKGKPEAGCKKNVLCSWDNNEKKCKQKQSIIYLALGVATIGVASYFMFRKKKGCFTVKFPEGYLEADKPITVAILDENYKMIDVSQSISIDTEICLDEGKYIIEFSKAGYQTMYYGLENNDLASSPKQNYLDPIPLAKSESIIILVPTLQAEQEVPSKQISFKVTDCATNKTIYPIDIWTPGATISTYGGYIGEPVKSTLGNATLIFRKLGYEDKEINITVDENFVSPYEVCLDEAVGQKLGCIKFNITGTKNTVFISIQDKDTGIYPLNKLEVSNQFYTHKDLPVNTAGYITTVESGGLVSYIKEVTAKELSSAIDKNVCVDINAFLYSGPGGKIVNVKQTLNGNNLDVEVNFTNDGSEDGCYWMEILDKNGVVIELEPDALEGDLSCGLLLNFKECKIGETKTLKFTEDLEQLVPEFKLVLLEKAFGKTDEKSVVAEYKPDGEIKDFSWKVVSEDEITITATVINNGNMNGDFEIEVLDCQNKTPGVFNVSAEQTLSPGQESSIEITSDGKDWDIYDLKGCFNLILRENKFGEEKPYGPSEQLAPNGVMEITSSNVDLLNDKFEVQIKVTNTGNITGNFYINLYDCNNQIFDKFPEIGSVQILPGDSATINCTNSGILEGYWDVDELGGCYSFGLFVKELNPEIQKIGPYQIPMPKIGNIGVTYKTTSCTNNTPIDTSVDEIDIDVTIQNSGGADGEFKATILNYKGDILEKTNLWQTITAGQSKTISLSSNNDAGWDGYTKPNTGAWTVGGSFKVLVEENLTKATKTTNSISAKPPACSVEGVGYEIVNNDLYVSATVRNTGELNGRFRIQLIDQDGVNIENGDWICIAPNTTEILWDYESISDFGNKFMVKIENDVYGVQCQGGWVDLFPKGKIIGTPTFNTTSDEVEFCVQATNIGTIPGTFFIKGIACNNFDIIVDGSDVLNPQKVEINPGETKEICVTSNWKNVDVFDFNNCAFIELWEDNYGWQDQSAQFKLNCCLYYTDAGSTNDGWFAPAAEPPTWCIVDNFMSDDELDAYITIQNNCDCDTEFRADLQTVGGSSVDFEDFVIPKDGKYKFYLTSTGKWASLSNFGGPNGQFQIKVTCLDTGTTHTYVRNINNQWCP